MLDYIPQTHPTFSVIKMGFNSIKSSFTSPIKTLVQQLLLQEMEKAKRNDWQIKPFPSRCKAVVIEQIYTKAELERITMGLIRQSMDDKWFIFYEEPWLYLHRSWTGLCIFKVCFEVVDEYAAVTEAWVNREAGERFGNMDIAEEKFLLEILLDCRAG